MDLELTSVQRRTLHELVDVGSGSSFPEGIEHRLRERIEEGILPFLGGSPIRLSKQRVNDLARCEGLFQSWLLGDGEPFRYGLRAAHGTLVHKAIELEIGSTASLDPRRLAERSARKLESDRPFTSFWSELDGLDRDQPLMSTVRVLESFRASFPPLARLRRVLAPVCEHWLEAGFAGGAVTVIGKVDLVLNQPDPVRATRVLVDLKTGRAWPDHPEDMRLYALLYTLRYGVPPYRVATLFLSSGVPQAELVGERLLEHAANRVVSAVRAAFELRARGRDPGLDPGPHCARCPRKTSCSAVPRLEAQAATAGLH
jgi:hypothetical protein